MSKVIYIEKTDIAATLTTWLYCNFAQMYASEQLGYSSYINWPDGFKPGRCLVDLIDKKKFKEELNMFSWFFNQPKVHYPPSRNNCEIWAWEYDGEKMQGHSLMSQPLKVIKDYYKKHLHFSDAVEQRGQLIVKNYGIDFKNTIGLTWRGTDCVTDGRPYLPIETYFPFIDDILKDNPNLSIMATAEEYGILEPLFDRYLNSFTLSEFISSPKGSKHNPERFSQVSGFERGMQPALMVWLFSKCAYYIKNRSSTGAVASWLSDGKIISLGHPENLGFPANTDTAEIEGELYPLHR